LLRLCDFELGGARTRSNEQRFRNRAGIMQA
jgi:hypothetical protein